jgi:hypothetical protein
MATYDATFPSMFHLFSWDAETDGGLQTRGRERRQQRVCNIFIRSRGDLTIACRSRCNHSHDQSEGQSCGVVGESVKARGKDPGTAHPSSQCVIFKPVYLCLLTAFIREGKTGVDRRVAGGSFHLACGGGSRRICDAEPRHQRVSLLSGEPIFYFHGQNTPPDPT